MQVVINFVITVKSCNTLQYLPIPNLPVTPPNSGQKADKRNDLLRDFSEKTLGK